MADASRKHKCLECDDVMFVDRYNGKSTPPFPKDWWFYVVHDHTQDPPRWVGCLFYRQPGGRYPQPAKLITAEQKRQRQAEVAERKAANAGRPGTKNRSN